MKSSVGPKPSSRFSQRGAPLSSGWALTTTPFVCSRWASWSVSANSGISVLTFVVGLALRYRSGCLSVAWIAVPLEVIATTLPARTC